MLPAVLSAAPARPKVLWSVRPSCTVKLYSGCAPWPRTCQRWCSAGMLTCTAPRRSAGDRLQAQRVDQHHAHTVGPAEPCMLAAWPACSLLRHRPHTHAVSHGAPAPDASQPRSRQPQTCNWGLTGMVTARGPDARHCQLELPDQDSLRQAIVSIPRSPGWAHRSLARTSRVTEPLV